MVNSMKGKIIKAEWFGNSNSLTQFYYRWHFCLTASNRTVSSGRMSQWGVGLFRMQTFPLNPACLKRLLRAEELLQSNFCVILCHPKHKTNRKLFLYIDENAWHEDIYWIPVSLKISCDWLDVRSWFSLFSRVIWLKKKEHFWLF